MRLLHARHSSSGGLASVEPALHLKLQLHVLLQSILPLQGGQLSRQPLVVAHSAIIHKGQVGSSGLVVTRGTVILIIRALCRIVDIGRGPNRRIKRLLAPLLRRPVTSGGRLLRR